MKNNIFEAYHKHKLIFKSIKWNMDPRQVFMIYQFLTLKTLVSLHFLN